MVFKLGKDTSFYGSSFVNKIIQEKEIYKQFLSGLLCLNTDVTPAAVSGNCYRFSLVTFPCLAIAERIETFPLYGVTVTCS